MKINAKKTGERISLLRKEKGLKQIDLAKKLNVSRQIISYYETGTRMPNVEDIIILSEFLGTSSDYLLGLSDVKTNDKDIQFICDYTGLSEESVNLLNTYKKHDSNPHCESSELAYEVGFLEFIDYLFSRDELNKNIFWESRLYKRDTKIFIKGLCNCAEAIKKLKESIENKSITCRQARDESLSIETKIIRVEKLHRINLLDCMDVFESVLLDFVKQENNELNQIIKQCEIELQKIQNLLISWGEDNANHNEA